MSGSNYTLKLDPERIKEMPMVDLAFEILKSANTPFYYRDLMAEIARVRELNEEGINQYIAHVYTEINIDGRFACVGNNIWGLKRWYPVEKAEDPLSNAKRTRIINDDDDLDEEDDLFADEEDNYNVDGEDFDAYDDQEEFSEGEDDDEHVEEEVDLDEEEVEEISLEEVEEEEYEDFEDEDK